MARTSTPSADKMFRRKEPESRQLTSERIADDLWAFQKAGGRIEVLGVTQMLKKRDEAPLSTTAPPSTPTARAATGSRRGSQA